MLTNLLHFCRSGLCAKKRALPPRHRQPYLRSTRRGVLLLVVVSMLALFLMLGAAYLGVSTRARRAARAFDTLSASQTADHVEYPRILDAALLHFLRGPANNAQTSLPSSSSQLTLLPFESLLEDKYGSATHITGTAFQPVTAILVVAGANTPSRPAVVQSGIQFLPKDLNAAPDVSTLAGRVVTLLGDGATPSSHRILHASPDSSSVTLAFANNAQLPKLGWTVPQPSFQSSNTAASNGIVIAIGQAQILGRSAPAVINGREFDGAGQRNEAWDGFDDYNPFLTHLAPSASAVGSTQVKKAAFVQSGTSASTLSLLNESAGGLDNAADNDNDGVNDAFYLDIGLPSLTAANGDTIRLHVSALIVDLDSRFNVNAHGSLSQISYPQSFPYWPSSPNLGNVPLGSGYGPAEVSAASMFKSDFYNTASLAVNEDPLRSTAAGLGTKSYLGRRPSGSRFVAGNGTTVSTPRLSNLEGRYAEPGKVSSSSSPLGNVSLISVNYPLARPGSPATDDRLSSFSDLLSPVSNGQIVGNLAAGIPLLWWDGQPNFNWQATLAGSPPPRSIYNSPPDLHGRMKTTTVSGTGAAIVPTVLFAKPEWGAVETTDDPYETPIANSRTRSAVAYGSGNDDRDNVFSVGEVEGVLRPYDTDSMLLPMRLNALLGSAAEESRLKITTDSWDTTMITGIAATKLSAWTKSLTGAVSGTTPVTGILNGEVRRGERLNLGRPMTGSKPSGYSATSLYYVQRQAFFKDLYTLLIALGATPNTATAQWAANVVEFRDADSTMTPFEFDTTITNGWDVDNDASTNTDPDRGLVWGTERPELLITHTSAWENETTGELFVGLYRPWAASALAAGTNTLPAEPTDEELDFVANGRPTNALDLGKKSNGESFSTSAAYPIWRVRIVDEDGATKYVRLDVDSPGTDEFTSANVTSADTTPKMGVDSWLCLRGSNSQNAVIDPAFNQSTLSGLRVPGTAKDPGTNRSATIFLERLSDPRAEATAAIWTQDPSTADSVPAYRIVDKAAVQVVNRRIDPITGQIPAGQTPSLLRRKTSGTTALWRIDPPCPAPNTAFDAQQPVRIAPPTPSSNPSDNPTWFVWPNRPLVGVAELLLVPNGDAAGILEQYTRPTTAINALTALNCPDIFDAVAIPTRFSGVHQTLNSDRAEGLATYAGIFPEIAPVNQLSAYREPGRVNVNTITTDEVWNAVVAGPLTVTGTAPSSGSPDPIKTRTTAMLDSFPAKNFACLLALSGTASATPAPSPVEDVELEDRNGNGALDAGEDVNGNGTLDRIRLPKSLNPSHAIYTATRLGNTATIRSNVFAIWITLRTSVDGDPDSAKTHRAFYIVDRSIPVAFESGKDHNVWDAVILRRIIE